MEMASLHAFSWQSRAPFKVDESMPSGQRLREWQIRTPNPWRFSGVSGNPFADFVRCKDSLLDFILRLFFFFPAGGVK
jgi:hypothetical protein